MPVVDSIAPLGNKRKRAEEAGLAAAGFAKAEKASVDLREQETTPTAWADKIAELKKSTLEARLHRQRLAKDLKSAQRKNKRLKERARMLSEEDMVQILVMKRAKTTSANEEAESSTSSSSKSDTGDSSPKTGPADGKQAREEEDAAGMQDGADQEADHQM